MATRPASYLNWVPSGNPAYIQQPTTGQSTTGWVFREAPPLQYLNWLDYTTDQWIQYLDSLTNISPTVLTTTGNTTIGSNALTSLASTTGILVGQTIMMTGVPANTYVAGISGSTVTMTQVATANDTAASVSFSHTYATGTTIQTELDELDSAFFTNRYTLDSISTNMGLPLGKTFTQFNANILGGVTWTVNGSFVTGNLQVAGTLIVPGTVQNLF